MLSFVIKISPIPFLVGATLVVALDLPGNHKGCPYGTARVFPTLPWRFSKIKLVSIFLQNMRTIGEIDCRFSAKQL
jgi:hypothetical protein